MKRYEMTLLILCVGVLWGCKSPSFEYKNTTPQKSVLQYTNTLTGQTVRIEMADDIDPKVLVSINTALANHEISGLQIIQDKAEHEQRRDNLDIVNSALNTVILLAIIGAGAYILGKMFERKNI